MQEATITLTVRWYLAEDEGPFGAGPTGEVARAVPGAMGEALKDHMETISFGREITNRVRDDHRMEGNLEIGSVKVKAKKNPSSPEEKARRRDRVAKGRKKKAKGRKKRSLAMQRALRGT